MGIVTRNVRGLGKYVKVAAVRRLLKDQQVEMALIQETKKFVLIEEDIRRLWFDDEFKFSLRKANENINWVEILMLSGAEAKEMSGLDRFLTDEQWCIDLKDLLQSGLKRAILIKQVPVNKECSNGDLVLKLRKLKRELKRSGENFDSKVKELEAKISILEDCEIEGNLEGKLLEKLKQCRVDLWESIKLQEEFRNQVFRATVPVRYMSY
ncbi:hypothetical protein GQ457_01G024160 [Hibiscus cannabinus]